MPGTLLILDTCEELAKADVGDPGAPVVTATLDIFDRLHEKAPATRVLLAGRRPLPRRSHLAVVNVGGFTVDKAKTYLARFFWRPLPPGLADAMIRASATLDTKAGSARSTWPWRAGNWRSNARFSQHP